MSVSIPSVIPNTSIVFSGPNSAAVRTEQPEIPTETDTVTLTEAQRAYQLYNQGQKATEIAASLSLPVETINIFLGLNGKA
jgi:hypothetical protein